MNDKILHSLQAFLQYSMITKFLSHLYRLKKVNPIIYITSSNITMLKGDFTTDLFLSLTDRHIAM